MLHNKEVSRTIQTHGWVNYGKQIITTRIVHTGRCLFCLPKRHILRSMDWSLVVRMISAGCWSQKDCGSWYDNNYFWIIIVISAAYFSSLVYFFCSNHNNVAQTTHSGIINKFNPGTKNNKLVTEPNDNDDIGLWWIHFRLCEKLNRLLSKG